MREINWIVVFWVHTVVGIGFDSNWGGGLTFLLVLLKRTQASKFLIFVFYFFGRKDFMTFMIV